MKKADEQRAAGISEDAYAPTEAGIPPAARHFEATETSTDGPPHAENAVDGDGPTQASLDIADSVESDGFEDLSDFEDEPENSDFGDLLKAVASAPSTETLSTLPEPGDVLSDNIELVRPLDEGGMGRVFVARDTVLGRLVAVKVVIPRGDAERRQRLVERFEQEARATARLNHPAIVTIHQFGVWHDQDDIGVPWVVLELLDGESLGARLEARADKGLGVADALRISAEICRGLSEAHEAGVIHRDLKPANIFLTVSGGVKILDFGLAWLDTGEGDLAKAGTPAYMAPEQWRGETQSPAVDLWGVGAMLHKMLSGRVPFISGRDVLEAKSRPRLPRLRDWPEVAELVSALLDPDPETRLSDASVVAGRLEKLRHEHAERDAVGAQPFVYLEPFTEDDAARFFGRDAEVARMAALLKHRSRVVLVGPSGAGKSSLVRAGLVPYLRRSEAGLEVVSIRPGDDPFERVSQALTRLDLADVPTAAELLEAPGQLGAMLRRRARSRSRTIIVVVDQLEECLAASPDVREAFFRLLSATADDVESPLRLVATVRDDHLARLAAETVARELLSGALVPLGPPDRVAMREAIAEPARRAGSPFVDEAVERILDELVDEPVPLPLLQLTASRLWERRAEGTAIGLDDLRALGGVTGILAGHADEVFLALAGRSRELGKAILLELTTPDGARRPADRSTLHALGEKEAVDAAIDELVRGHLLRVVEDEFEIVHDAILEHWSRLRTWLAESNVDRRFRDRVERAAADWAAHTNPRGLLWRGEVLDAASRWRMDAPTLTETAESFLDHGERLRRRSLWLRRGIVVLVVMAALGVSIASLLVTQRVQEEEAEARKAREQSDQLVAFMLFELHDGLSDVGRLDLLERVVGAVEAYYGGDVRGQEDALRRTVALEHLGDVRRAQGDMDGAAELYKRSLALAEEYGDETTLWLAARAESLEAQSEVMRVMGNRSEARRALEEARDLRQTLAASESAEAWADLSAVELSMGDLFRQMGQTEDARAAYESALVIRQQLVSERPQDGQRRHDLAEASMRLADIAFAHGMLADAEKSYADAVATLKGVVEAYPGHARWQLTLALGLVRLSEVLTADGRPSEAWEHGQNARTRFRRLVRLDPANADWRMQLALADVALAGMAQELGRVEEATTSIDDALKTLEELLELDPYNVDWRRALASAWTEKGDIALSSGESRAALDAFDRGLNLRRDLMIQSPGDPARIRALATSWFYVSEARRALGESDAAIASMERSLELRRSLVARSDRSPEWLYDLATAARQMATMQARLGRFQQRLEGLEEAAAAAQTLVEMQPDEPRALRLQAVLQVQLGNAAVERSNLAEAQAAFETAAAGFAGAARTRPDNVRWQRDAAMARNMVGDVLRSQGKLDAAAEAYKKSLQSMLVVLDTDVENVSWQRDVSVILDRIGDIRREQGDLTKASAAYDKSLSIAKRLAALDVDNVDWQRDLSVSYDKLGDVLLEEGRAAEALMQYQGSLQILDKLLEQDPGRVDWQRDKALSLERMSHAAHDAGKHGKAQRSLRASYALLETLATTSPDDMHLVLDRARVMLDLAHYRLPKREQIAQLLGEIERLDPEHGHEEAQNRSRDLRKALVGAAVDHRGKPVHAHE